jgi:hypothetical protein
MHESNVLQSLEALQGAQQKSNYRNRQTPPLRSPHVVMKSGFSSIFYNAQMHLHQSFAVPRETELINPN